MSGEASSNRLEYEQFGKNGCAECFWSYRGSNSLNGWKMMCAQTKDDVVTFRAEVCQGNLWEQKFVEVIDEVG